ncbi:hypothetical protein ABT300_42865, partial [Streptomyces sp. NPDC001027]|uniref:hypothetical protein n=1 Tax=Streptomyces sp. NPDC001027 TaxID=3154771 RepID=UPI00332CEBDB
QVATAAAMLAWLIYEKIRHGAFTTLGAASGAVFRRSSPGPAGLPRVMSVPCSLPWVYVLTSGYARRNLPSTFGTSSATAHRRFTA